METNHILFIASLLITPITTLPMPYTDLSNVRPTFMQSQYEGWIKTYIDAYKVKSNPQAQSFLINFCKRMEDYQSESASIILRDTVINRDTLHALQSARYSLSDTAILQEYSQLLQDVTEGAFRKKLQIRCSDKSLFYCENLEPEEEIKYINLTRIAFCEVVRDRFSKQDVSKITLKEESECHKAFLKAAQ